MNFSLDTYGFNACNLSIINSLQQATELLDDKDAHRLTIYFNNQVLAHSQKFTEYKAVKFTRILRVQNPKTTLDILTNLNKYGKIIESLKKINEKNSTIQPLPAEAMAMAVSQENHDSTNYTTNQKENSQRAISITTSALNPLNPSKGSPSLNSAHLGSVSLGPSPENGDESDIDIFADFEDDFVKMPQKEQLEKFVMGEWGDWTEIPIKDTTIEPTENTEVCIIFQESK